MNQVAGDQSGPEPEEPTAPRPAHQENWVGDEAMALFDRYEADPDFAFDRLTANQLMLLGLAIQVRYSWLRAGLTENVMRYADDPTYREQIARVNAKLAEAQRCYQLAGQKRAAA